VLHILDGGDGKICPQRIVRRIDVQRRRLFAQAMQVDAAGRASRRPSSMGRPQRSQKP
jgi:hypothetical protein